MQHTTTAATIAFLGLMAALPARADEAEEIKKLVPGATAIPRQTFDKISKGDSGVRPSDFDELSLTAVLLGAGPELNTKGKEAKEGFEVLGRTLNPGKFAQELSQTDLGIIRLPSQVVTAVHFHRITEFTCKIDGDMAKGTVSYKVPNLYRGRFDYVAKRNGGKWEISAIAMPAHRVYLVRDEKGKWTKQ